MIPGFPVRTKGSGEDPMLQRVRIMNGFIFLVLLAASQIFMSPYFTLGVVVGGLVILVNFHLLSRILNKAFIPGRLASPKVVILKYYVRLLGTGILLYVLISRRWVDPLGLMAGLSVVVIALTLVGCYEMRKILSKEAN